jgi:DNA-binding response OmpR family regulator
VAEDDPVNRKVLKYQLETLGFRVGMTSTWRAVLDCWRRASYSILLTDRHMPAMNGFELSAGSYADDFMSKPILPADLGAMLGRWVQPV